MSKSCEDISKIKIGEVCPEEESAFGNALSHRSVEIALDQLNYLTESDCNILKNIAEIKDRTKYHCNNALCGKYNYKNNICNLYLLVNKQTIQSTKKNTYKKQINQYSKKPLTANDHSILDMVCEASKDFFLLCPLIHNFCRALNSKKYEELPSKWRSHEQHLTNICDSKNKSEALKILDRIITDELKNCKGKFLNVKEFVTKQRGELRDGHTG